MKNILNSVFETQHQSAPFEQIQTTYFIPALELEISKTLEEIDHICSNPAIPTFENTLEALEQSGEQLGIISGILFNLNSAETSNELQEVTQKAAPLLTKFQNDVRLNKVLFDRIKNIFDKKETLALDPEQLTLIEKEYKGFVRNGALLSAEDKDKLRLIDTELAQLSLSFGEHVLADTQAFELHLTDKKQLSGLPQTSITQAEALAKEKNKDQALELRLPPK